METETANVWLVITGAISAIAASSAVIITYCGSKETVEIAQKATEAAREQLKVELGLKRDETFESIPILRARKKLAEQFYNNEPHDEISEDVMNFFETIGMLLRREFLDEEMVWISFGYYGIRWWFICKDYIYQERILKNDDITIFAEFEFLANILCKIDARERGKTKMEVIPSTSDLRTFLEEEASLDIA